MTNEDPVNTNPKIIHFTAKPKRFFPNSELPVLIYRKAFQVGKQQRKAAALIQAVFHKNNWRNAWSNGVYDFHHYHSNTHECMTVAAGRARVIIGGPGGMAYELRTGDLVILPAGVAHRCVKASPDLLCIGAYPSGRQYDINLGTKAEFDKARARIHRLPKPAKDPLLGKEGFLRTFWRE